MRLRSGKYDAQVRLYAFDILAFDGETIFGSCRFRFASRSFRGFWRGGVIDVVG